MKTKRSRWLRYGVQLGFLAFMTYMGYMHQKLGGGTQGAPTVDALCPLGGMESIYGYITSGTWLRRTAPSALILFGAVALMTVLLGRIFCGWICPLGTIGEWSSKIGKKLGIKQIEIPDGPDRVMRLGKYVVMAIAVFGAWYYGTLLWRDYDPWVAWMHISAGWAEVEESPWAFAVLFGTVIGASFFVERFWCRYLCPLGGLLSILQKFSLVKVRRDDSTCVHCMKCDSSCPMGLKPESAKVVTSGDCIACGECVESCPVADTLEAGTSGRKISPMAMGIVGLIIFFGIYGTAKTTGYWQTYASAPKGVTVEDPAEYVYGWMSLEQVSDQVGLPIEKLVEIGNLPEGIPTDVAMKRIEGVDDHEFTEALSLWFEANDVPKTEMSAIPENPDEIKGSLTLLEIGTMYGVDPSEIVDMLRDKGWTGEISLEEPVKDIAKSRGEEVQVIRDAVKDILGK